MMVCNEPEGAVGSFSRVDEAVGGGERVVYFFGEGIRDRTFYDVEAFAGEEPDAMGRVGEEAGGVRDFCELGETLGGGVGV